jgi:hypothetical protein
MNNYNYFFLPDFFIKKAYLNRKVFTLLSEDTVEKPIPLCRDIISDYTSDIQKFLLNFDFSAVQNESIIPLFLESDSYILLKFRD